VANLTVTVDERVLRRARIKALEQGTSVNALVSDYLTRFAGMGATEKALGEFVEIAQQSTASSGPGGRTWRREDLYDRPKYLNQE
jgi:hypothetical protein